MGDASEGEPLTVPEVHYRVKHSPYKTELVRYGQFLFNDASWGLQGEYACASCHYERGQTTGLIWDLGDEGWGSWKNTKYIRGGRYLPPFRHEGFTGHPDEIVGATSSLDRVCGRDPRVCVQERELFTGEVGVHYMLHQVFGVYGKPVQDG